MGIVNQGSQTITFDFKLPAKGSTFNKLNRDVIQPGIYSGLKISYVGNNVFISEGTVVFDCSFSNVDNLQVKINFDSIFNYGVVNPSTISQNEVLYLEYEYGEVIENFADFKRASFGSFDFTNKNLVVIGELVYDISNNITSINYSNRSFGLINSDLNYAIPDNKKFYNISDETKFFYFNGSNLPNNSTKKINIPTFSESESDLLVTNNSNTTIIKNNLLASGTISSNNSDITNNLNVSGTGTINTLNINSISYMNRIDYDYDTVNNSSSSVTINYSSKSFVVLKNNNPSLATVITLSIPNVSGTSKIRNIYLLVRSNGNYSFNSSTSQGGVLRFPSGFSPFISANGFYDLYSFITNGYDVFSTFAFNYSGAI